ncbi:MAG: AAA family ATPase, partial [Nitrososphaeraceae archaeon]
RGDNSGFYDLNQSIYDKINNKNSSFCAVILGKPGTSFIFPKQKINEFFNAQNKTQRDERHRWMFSILSDNNKYFLKVTGTERINISDYLNRWDLIPDIQNIKDDQKNYFLIQVSERGSNNILKYLKYSNPRWKDNKKDYDHGKVKNGDYLLIYFSGDSIDFKKQVKKVYLVNSVSEDKIEFKISEIKNLNGIFLKNVKTALQDKKLSDVFNNIGRHGFNIIQIDKTDYNSIINLDKESIVNKGQNLWLIRAGDKGQEEQISLDNNFISIGYDGLPGLHNITDFNSFKEHYKKTHPSDGNNRVGNIVPQIWNFINDVKIGDFLVLPLKTKQSKIIAVGKISGNYEFGDLNSGIKQFRSVFWFKKDVPRNEFDPEIEKSLDNYGTIDNIGSQNLVNKLKTMLVRLGINKKDLENTVNVNNNNKLENKYYTQNQNRWLLLTQEDIKKIVNKVLTFHDKILAIDENIIKRIIAHLVISKHVILVGTPGTGKTDLARRLLRELGNIIINNPEPIEAVASYEWGRYEVIGGRSISSDDNDGSFHFGCVTNAIMNNKLLLIDEFNRADMNKAFGEMFLALDHGEIQLREDEDIFLKNNGNDHEKYYLNTRDDDCVYHYDDKSKKIEIPINFRMICTMNDYDKSLLNELSYGLLRRFAFIEINVPNDKELVKNIIIKRSTKKLEPLSLNFKNKKINEYIDKFVDFMFALKEKREIGLASYIDVISFLLYSNTALKNDVGSSLNQALIDYILPQFDRLDIDTIRWAHTKASEIFIDENEKRIESISPFLENLDKRMKRLESLNKLFEF